MGLLFRCRECGGSRAARKWFARDHVPPARLALLPFVLLPHLERRNRREFRELYVGGKSGGLIENCPETIRNTGQAATETQLLAGNRAVDTERH